MHLMTTWKMKIRLGRKTNCLRATRVSWKLKDDGVVRWSGCWFDGEVMRGADCNKMNWWAQAQKQSDESDVYVTYCVFDTSE
jgi:hypothetical protein